MKISTKNVLLMFYFKFQLEIFDHLYMIITSWYLCSRQEPATTNFSGYKVSSTILVLILRIQCVSSTILVLQNPCLHHSPNQSLNRSCISSPEIADIELGDFGLHCCPLLSSAIPFIHSSKFKMASRRKSVPVLNYNELNNLSSECII